MIGCPRLTSWFGSRHGLSDGGSGDLIRLSIPVRQAMAKLTLPVLIAAAFGLLLVGKADALLAERARMALADALAPIYGVLAEPMARVQLVIDNARQMATLYQDNSRLREEND